MVKKGFVIIAAFAALALASEIEDNEQKKRGAGKASTLNAIPTGAQKPDYTYSIYTQSAQSNPTQSYQSQVPNSFYPSQVASQYYNPSNNPDISTSNSLHTQVTPNINSQVPQHTQSQFVPINFVPNLGYQSKYQIISPKPSGNLQLAIIQQPAIQPPSILQYPHSLFSPSHTNLITPQNGLGTQGHLSFSPAVQPFSFGGSYLGQPSMVLLPHTHTGLYNNLVYPNPTQSFYNYYPSISQAKYSYASGPTVSQSNDQPQSTVPQSVVKDDSISAQNSEYITPSDSSSGYKNAYTRSTYSKL